MLASTVTSWKELRLALGKQIGATGRHGFEGLLARLFAAETGQPFYLARTGDQPVGDAYGPLAGIALQAKQYITSKIDAKSVEGDIDVALRETPGTDIFIVASTRLDNQLKHKLEQKTEETGVDIVFLAFTDKLSPLGALCVKHWNIVSEFFPMFDIASNRWAEIQLKSPKTLEVLAELHAELSGLPTRILVSEIAKAYLQARVDGDASGYHTHNRVNVTDGIPRPKLRHALQDWWEAGNDHPIATLEGEEGTGKTWLAADFGITFSSETSIILWLDSLIWSGAKTVEEVILTSLKHLFLPGDTRPWRVLQKIFRRWNEPILLILDGANEREARDAAEYILYDYNRHRSEIRARVRILFTSRPIPYFSRAGQSFWGDAKIVAVGPFDDAEFASAMEKFAPDVRKEALTDAVRELAKIPRYFRLCLELREKLASLTHLNREILLWADLETKLDRCDPQWFSVQKELDASPSEILAHLAEQIGWPVGKAAVENAEIERHLPGFHKVRADFREQRIVISGDLGHTILSTEHLILGWALVIQSVAEMHSSEDPDALYERIQRLLEPAASNDDKARAVHVAALLAFFSQSTNSGPIRSVLLRLWALHHNAHITAEMLDFFVKRDLAAYIEAVETLFRVYLQGDFETTLIFPLALLWRANGSNLPLLRRTLERWLRLIFPGDARGSKGSNKIPPSKFIAAKTSEQLRLSYAAAGIVSFRPEQSLIPLLLDCFQSDKFCYADTGHPEVMARWRTKSSYESLGVIARWHYQEPGLSIIETFADGLEHVVTRV